MRIPGIGRGTWLLALGLAVLQPAHAGKMYWTDAASGRILRAELDGSNAEVLVTVAGSPHSIALHLDAGKIYWTNRSQGKLQRADVDGSNVEDLLTGLPDPFGIALDEQNAKVYWTDFTDEKIRRANLDGTAIEDVITPQFGPWGIALDLPGGKIYWGDNECSSGQLCQPNGKVRRADLGGGPDEELFLLNTPVAIALDGTGKIYVASTMDGIARANLDGTGREFIFPGVANGIALDVAGGQAYWTRANLVRRGNLDESDVEIVYTEPGATFRGIALALCTDVDGDGFCAGLDCDDANPDCRRDCTDGDGDGFCAPQDCDDGAAACATDCSDADGDGLTPCEGDCDNSTASCTTVCTDNDGDGLAICAGDCDDANAACTIDCTDTDADGFCLTFDCDDAVAGCTTECTDADADGLAVCAGDCDDANANCTNDCTDADADGFCVTADCDDWNQNCRTDCTDADGDGLCVGVDCDDGRSSCTTVCTDADGDGLTACAGDCDDANPGCTTSCVDLDGDGLCVPQDCDDGNASCTVDCTDLDGDGFCVSVDCNDSKPSCTTDCTDVDGDGFCAPLDCDDTVATCATDCTDADGDGLALCAGDCDDGKAACTTDCTDADGDGVCITSDCDDTNAGCAADCSDGDGDGLTPCDGDCDNTLATCTLDCTDADGDGLAACAGDCDDANATCTTDCTDLDGDGFCTTTDCDDSLASCTTDCGDADGDGLRSCDGDCDDSRVHCTMDCTDADLDDYCVPVDCDDTNANCNVDCTDADQDSYCAPLDCDETNANCTFDCTDADLDGFCVGPDCLDSDPRANPSAREVCTDGVDTDCDGADDATDAQCVDLVVSGLVFADATNLSWIPAADADGYALYRGDIPTTGFASYNHRCEATEIAAPAAQDPDSPRPGEAFYYLAGGMSIDSASPGTPIDVALGLASGGGARPDSESTTCGRRVYVDPDLLVSGDGLSWATAYTRVSTALLHQEAPERSLELWVRGTEDRPISFDDAFRPGARLLGGFAGHETAAWQRYPAVNPTVLQGDGAGPAFRATGVDLVLDGVTLRGAPTGVSATLADDRLELTDVLVESIPGYGLDVTADGGEISIRGSSFDASGLGGIRVVVVGDVLSGTIRDNAFLGASDAALRLEARPDVADAEVSVDVVANRISGGVRGLVLGAHVDDRPRNATQSSFVASNLIHDVSGDAILVEAVGSFSTTAAAAAARSVPRIVGNTLSDGGAAGMAVEANRSDSTADPSIHEVRAAPRIWDNLITFHAGPGIEESTDDEAANLVADPGAIVGNDLFGNAFLYLDEGASSLDTLAAVNALPGSLDNLESDPVYVDRVGRDYHIQFGTVLGFGDAMRYLANDADPGVGSIWTAPAFDDSSWQPGFYGVGFDAGPAPNAQDLLLTQVAGATRSVYTRISFTVEDPSGVTELTLGADYDSGWAAWINGTEVFRSASLPAGPLEWNTVAVEHESSNASTPVYEQQDVSAAGIPVLLPGPNVLAVAVWGAAAPTDDLVLVPRLIVNNEFEVIDAGHLDAPRLAVQDLDGQPRVEDGNGDGIARPDVGADERR